MTVINDFRESVRTAKLHRNPPFRAEHLGSLLRPKNLLEARVGFDEGAVQQKRLTLIEDNAVKDIVDLQIKLGFYPISDGEYRQHSMFQSLLRPFILILMQCFGVPSSQGWMALRKLKM